MARKAQSNQRKASLKSSRLKTKQKQPTQKGRVVKARDKRKTKSTTTSSKAATNEGRRFKREADQQIKIKISKEVIHKKGRGQKRKKYKSTDYKRVGLDHPTSSPAIAKMTENDRIKGAMKDLALGKFKFVSKAAAYWRVHAAKLYRRHNGEVPLDAKRGPRKVLLEQDEEDLVNWVVTMGKRGFPVAPGMVCDAVKTFFKKDGNPFTNDRPSHTWYHKFVRRHPKLMKGLKMSKMTSICRAELTNSVLDEWFNELQCFLTDLCVADKPRQIWSYGETGFEMNKRTERIVMNVLKPKGKAQDDEHHRREIKICICANAGGDLLPPFIICKGLKNSHKEFDFLNGAPKGAEELLLERSHPNRDIFGYWINNFFVHKVEENVPVVLLVDLNESDITYGAYAIASEHNIHFFRVPPKAAALVQPVNIGEDGPFKSNWLMKWVKSNRHVSVNVRNVGSVVGDAWQEAEQGELIRGCFLQAGVYPLDREMVDDEHLPSGTLKFLSTVDQSQVDFDNDQALNDDSESEVDIPESDQPIAALLLFQKLDDTLDKSKRELYRTCIENNLDIADSPLFPVWRKLYLEAFKNDPNVPMTSVEVVVTTTDQEKLTTQDAEEPSLEAAASDDKTICPVCSEKFGGDEEEWIGCDGECQQWFHVNCLPPELVTPVLLEDKEMFCPQCTKSRKPSVDSIQH
ncbi:uncharacterized protein LOC117302191 [Asterias rubens]|uniref:uncharacterized protein LOC117302191 n=1 Tax=Asterias rubens TaxID=7604 RepID=UPI00145575D8|nr:uncharacterized protein LOC117302191 [Asterias rubens]